MNENLPAYVNMSIMAKLLYLSRSRLYQLIDQGVLLKPVHLINNKRPVYTREMAMRNIEVKNNNIGINGEIVMFYSTRTMPNKPKRTIKKSADQNAVAPNKHADLIDALESLGLENVTAAKIDYAIYECFPDGTKKISEDDILTTVFRFLNCQNSEHKPRA